MHSNTETMQDMDVELPSVEGLLAGTLALMTGYAQRSAGLRGQTEVDLMAKKIASNLHFLKTHPCLSLPFAAVLNNLHGLWMDLSAQSMPTEPRSTSSWHGAPAAVQ
jgi:hypothetical protein